MKKVFTSKKFITKVLIVLLISLLLLLNRQYILLAFQEAPPKEKISSSIFSNGGSLEAFEKNVDDKGIPIVTEGYTNKTGYHPSWICRYTIYLTSRYEEKQEKSDFKRIQNLLDWIEENKVYRLGYITWELKEDLDAFNLKAPWTSALTNAWCAGALLQGYKVTGEESLEKDSKLALEYLFTPVLLGGGMYSFPDGGIWFEEAPSVRNPSHILNGFIYAIDILDMFASSYDNERYDKYLEKSLETLRKNVDKYDVGYGSIYDQYTKGNKLGMSYHRLHYVQLYYIYLKTGDEHYYELSKKWFELYKQSDYRIKEESILSEEIINPLSNVNNGVYWSRHWQGFLPVEIVLEVDKKYKFYGINFFGLSGESPTEAMDIYYKDSNGLYIKIPKLEYNIEYAGKNENNNGNITKVYKLSFNSGIETDTFKIIFNKTEVKEYVYLREIGLWKDMEIEYQEEMKRFSNFSKTVEFRK